MERNFEYTRQVTSPQLSVNLPNVLPGPGHVTNLLARSFNTGSRFSVRLNNQLLRQVDLPAIGNGIYDAFARFQKIRVDFPTSSSALNLSFDYSPGSVNSQGWLDWFEIFARRELSMTGVNQLLFRDWNSVQPQYRPFKLKGNAQRAFGIYNPLSPSHTTAVTADGFNLRRFSPQRIPALTILPSYTAAANRYNQNLHGTSG